MQSIITTCEPRNDILEGTFNPEIFTASLNEVMAFYQHSQPGIHSIYTDPIQFFSEGTFATDGFKTVVGGVFARLAGDGTAPAIHRLETAFGGGKTHTLIACAHIAFHGDEIADSISDLLPAQHIPQKKQTYVVGISGIDIPVHKPQGTHLIPYTLWGEIAYQIGGEELYKQVEEDAVSSAAPGKNYFDSVLKGRKVLIMIDELAQYAARLSAANSDGGNQLAAFLLSLHDYARSNSGISIILTLASATDAFSKQTGELAKLLSEITGKQMSADDALGVGEKAIDDVSSVVARDATSVVPVQASEISRVLAKRLFKRIDENAAVETAGQYRDMYKKSSDMLPDKATRNEFHEILIEHYPFHPTFINFLNNKLATYENFQGTRGVLRVLALAIRNLWDKQAAIPMIHACHLDLRNARIVNEVIGRTGSSSLLTVLNADVGGAETDSLTGGSSNAEEADQRNPHPEGYPLYEYTWKTVFLHSLVGRDQGLGSNIFGLTEQDALFEVSFPGLTPPQVAEALKEISNSAFYLRFQQGRYFASLDPSVNVALAKIRRGLQNQAIESLLDATARKVVSDAVGPFTIIQDVSAPEGIPEKTGKPTLAMISLKADPIRVEAFVTSAGPNRPRIEQNLVFLLVPETVKTATGKPEQQLIADSLPEAQNQSRQKLSDLARWVLAMRTLKKNPENFGITAAKLDQDDFKQRHTERENALISMVTECYRHLWYPSASGQIVCKEIRTAGGESGVPVMEQIRKALLDDKELITNTHTTGSDLTSLKKLFFGQKDIVKITAVKESFCRIRKWPILESPEVLAQIIRAGVNNGTWCLFRMGSEETTLPDEFYSRDTGELPLDINPEKGYSLITPEGAKQRQWDKSGPDPQRLQEATWKIIREQTIGTVAGISDKLGQSFGEVDAKEINHTLQKLIQQSKLMAFKGQPNQQEKPDLITGSAASFYVPEKNDVIITPSKASENGWIDKEDNTIYLSGQDGTQAVLPLLRRLGAIYAKGGKSHINFLDITDLELPAGGKLRVTLEDASPETVQHVGELFEMIDSLVSTNAQTNCDLTINHPESGCPFVQELQKNSAKESQ